MNRRVVFREADPRRRGVALLYAVFGAFVAASLVSVMLTMASVTRRGSGLKLSQIRATYLAEGAVEAAKKEIQVAIANWEDPPTSGMVEIGTEAVSYSIAPTGASEIVTDATGIQTILTSYEIVSTATYERVQRQAHRIINAESTPIFQFAVFYTEDLEIHPGPNMTLSGRVHTNRNMYLGCGNTLTMNTNYVRSVGEMYRKKKDSGQSNGTVKIRKWVEDPYDTSISPEYVTMNSRGQMTNLGVTTESGYDSDFSLGHDDNGDGDFDDATDILPFLPGALEYWSEASTESEEGNTVLTGSHGVSEAVSPSIGSIKMYEEAEAGNYVLNGETGEYELALVAGTGQFERGFYHENAGLSIIVNEDGTDWVAYDVDGVDMKPALDAAGAVTLDSIYDARQSTNSDQVPTVTVDMNKLGQSGAFPANGLLYTSHYGLGEGTDAKGLKIVNGSELLAALTTVAEGSAYVQGDFNNVDRKGASVIADAASLLSNSWDNSKTQGTLPVASTTTYYMAIITGNHDTEEGGNYNGGLENLPRFHEKWTNMDCNIFGSFVNAWTSEYATGLWQYGSDRYNAPKRRWSYDPYFNRVANLPPFTPMVVTATDIVSW